MCVINVHKLVPVLLCDCSDMGFGFYVDRQTDRQTESLTDGRKNRQTDGKTFRHLNKQIDRQTVDPRLAYHVFHCSDGVQVWVGRAACECLHTSPFQVTTPTESPGSGPGGSCRYVYVHLVCIICVYEDHICRCTCVYQKYKIYACTYMHIHIWSGVWRFQPPPMV